MIPINWNLIANIFSALRCFEDYHGWDLSTGENAALAESFYNDFIKGLPRSREELEQIFERARVAVWGKDHECDKVIKNCEMHTLITNVGYDTDLVDIYEYCEKVLKIDQGILHVAVFSSEDVRFIKIQECKIEEEKGIFIASFDKMPQLLYAEGKTRWEAVRELKEEIDSFYTEMMTLSEDELGPAMIESKRWLKENTCKMKE